MSRINKLCLWRFAAVVFSLIALGAATGANAAQDYLKDAEQLIAAGNVSAAAAKLRDGLSQSPDDPRLHARLADVMANQGYFASAAEEALAARQHNGDEATYLPVLSKALLHEQKFTDILKLITPGNRAPSLESRVRLTRGLAYVGLHEPEKAEADLREAVKLDQAPELKITLARFLGRKSPDESEKLLDEALATASPNEEVEALQLKGELLRGRGDTDGAMRLFDKAIKESPTFIPALLSRASLNIALNRFDRLDADITPILRVVPNHLQANYLLAYAAVKQGEFADADSRLDRITDGFDEFPLGYFLRGLVKFGLGKYPEAEQYLSKYLDRVPDDSAAVRLAAATALRQGHAEQAIAYLKPLIERAPDAPALSLLGDAYIAAGSPERALEQFEKAAALDPDNPQLRHDIATSQIRSGQDEKALAELEQAFEGKSGAAIAGPTLMLSELSARHVDKAAKIGETLVADDAKNPLYQTLLGLVRATQADYPAAETAFRNALALAPGFAAPAQNLAKLYIALGRVDDAKALYDGLLAKQPDNPAILVGRADIAIIQKDWLYAIAILNRAREAAPKDLVPGLRLVNVYLLQRDWTNAKDLSAKLAGQFPDNGEVLTRYLQSLIATKDFADAKSVMRAAIARDPNNALLKADMIRLVAAADGIDAAAEQAQTFDNADPAGDVYDLAMADLYEKAGQNPAATTLLENRIVRQPTDVATAITLAGIYRRAKEFGKAEAVLKRQGVSDDLRAAIALGSIYAEDGKLDAAIAQYSLIRQKNPKDPRVLNNLAWTYQQMGNLDEARQFAEQAVAVAPRAPQMEDTLGWILLAQGEADKAVTYLASASLSAPGEPEFQYHLAVALRRVGRGGDAEKLLDGLLGLGKPFRDHEEAEKLLRELRAG